MDLLQRITEYQMAHTARGRTPISLGALLTAAWEHMESSGEKLRFRHLLPHERRALRAIVQALTDAECPEDLRAILGNMLHGLEEVARVCNEARKKE